MLYQSENRDNTIQTLKDMTESPNQGAFKGGYKEEIRKIWLGKLMCVLENSRHGE